MNRGSRREPTYVEVRKHSFNEAPIHESGKWISGPARGADRSASMRPRFMNRGSPKAISAPEPTAPAASMRPRFMNRGSGAFMTREIARRFVLQ